MPTRLRPPLRLSSPPHSRRPIQSLLFHTYPTRPRLPFLSPPRTHIPQQPPTFYHYQQQQRRLLQSIPLNFSLSRKTKSYLWDNTVFAGKFLLWASLAQTTYWGGYNVYRFIHSERRWPTPACFPWAVRWELSESRWKGVYGKVDEEVGCLKNAVGMLEGVVEGKSGEWREGYLELLLRLGGHYVDGGRDVEGAKGVYRRVLEFPDYDDGGGGGGGGYHRVAKSKAALRLSKIAEFEKDLEAAEEYIWQAITFANPQIHRPASSEQQIPITYKNTPQSLEALTELSIFHARHSNLPLALSILTSILQARRTAPKPLNPAVSKAADEISDPCAEAVTMTYIGEMLFAAGEKKMGVWWSKEAFGLVEGLVEERGGCRECAIVTAGNIKAMLERVKEEEVVGGGERRGWWWLWAGEKGREQEVLGEEEVEVWKERVEELKSIRVVKGR